LGTGYNDKFVIGQTARKKLLVSVTKITAG